MIIKRYGIILTPIFVLFFSDVDVHDYEASALCSLSPGFIQYETVFSQLNIKPRSSYSPGTITNGVLKC